MSQSHAPQGVSKASDDRARDRPALVVLSSVFPHRGKPITGVFVQERTFRVAGRLPSTFVVPVAWFPLQSVIRRFWPAFRPAAPKHELREGFEIFYPRFLSVPAVVKRLDGLLMALGVLPLLLRLRKTGRVDIIDAHFAYPDGFAAMCLGRWLGLPYTVTIRGNEKDLSASGWGRRMIAQALHRADRVFCVSEDLRCLALELGCAPDAARVVPNGVDATRFRRIDQRLARERLNIPVDAGVIVTVGALVECKGQHRVIDCMPALVRRHPTLVYLVVGGETYERGRRRRLERQVRRLGLEDHVRFVGEVLPDALSSVLSAADLFVLATRREGRANVLMEAMACGLPAVATEVGGNGEVLSGGHLGILVPFGDPRALEAAIDAALTRPWDRGVIIAHARKNGWDRPVGTLVREFRQLVDVEARRVTAGNASVDRPLPVSLAWAGRRDRQQAGESAPRGE